MNQQSERPTVLAPEHVAALKAVAHGLKGTSLDRELTCAPGAGRRYVREARARLGAHTDIHAVVLAIRHGWLEQ